jgi:transcription antitermination factor NusG
VDNLTTRELRPPWYCGRVAPGRERAFERGLRRWSVATYFPVHLRNVTRTRYDWQTQSNKPQSYTRELALFPGYVFAQLDLSDWPWLRERIAHKPQWIAFGGTPAQIPVELIEQLQTSEQNGFVQPVQQFREGDELEICESGIWYSRRGILASDPDRRILTLHLIAESYALQPTQVLTKLKIDRANVRSANYV